jgi:hypothetical protein
MCMSGTKEAKEMNPVSTKRINYSDGSLMRVDVYVNGSLVGHVQRYSTRWSMKVQGEATLRHIGALTRKDAIDELLDFVGVAF